MSDPAPGLDRLAAIVARVGDGGDPLDTGGALALVEVADVEAVLHPTTAASDAGGGSAPRDGTEGELVATGLAASPGVARGVAVFDGWRALDVVDEGRAVILVRPETSPADEPAMSVVEGVVTSRGGLGSHAAVIARGRGLPAVCGAHHLDIGDDSFTTDEGVVVSEGDELVIDGGTGQIRRPGRPADGGVAPAPSEGVPAPKEAATTLPPDLATVLGWADERRRGHLAVQANADTAADAERARQFGAEGIGLCRTEHQFLAPERLDLLRRVILASSPEPEHAALEELGRAQEGDFEALLAAMDGLVVTVRLLDPPLHEFLPDLVGLERADAAHDLDEPGRQVLDAARRWHEHNPMLGVRGVRLAVLRPALYRMQIRSLVRAAARRRADGGTPRPQIMIPLVSTAAELVLARTWVDEVVEAERATGPTTAAAGGPAEGQGSRGPEVAVGAMIETPRAALVAGQLARVADFLSFGTNDLTQLTFGLGRDDGGRLLEAYRTHDLLPDDPFATLDPDGVGALIVLAAAAARSARPGISLGVCGEHGGDPASIRQFLAAGLDYVSCSPFRVPVARLAAAQAVLGSSRATAGAGSPRGERATTSPPSLS